MGVGCRGGGLPRPGNVAKPPDVRGAESTPGCPPPRPGRSSQSAPRQAPPGRYHVGRNANRIRTRSTPPARCPSGASAPARRPRLDGRRRGRVERGGRGASAPAGRPRRGGGARIPATRYRNSNSGIRGGAARFRNETSGVRGRAGGARTSFLPKFSVPGRAPLKPRRGRAAAAARTSILPKFSGPHAKSGAPALPDAPPPAATRRPAL